MPNETLELGSTSSRLAWPLTVNVSSLTPLPIPSHLGFQDSPRPPNYFFLDWQPAGGVSYQCCTCISKCLWECWFNQIILPKALHDLKKKKCHGKQGNNLIYRLRKCAGGARHLGFTPSSITCLAGWPLTKQPTRHACFLTHEVRATTEPTSSFCEDSMQRCYCSALYSA